MIRATLYIRKYDWIVHCYFALDCYYAHEIVSQMARIGANERQWADAWNSMVSENLNGGLTYSNFRRRESVLVTELTSSPEEFLNTYVHEIGHLATHIAQADGIDLKGEEVRYLEGELAMALYPKCKRLMCCKCHCEA